MSIEQRRAEVARLSADGLSQRQIAERLGCDHSTVLRDLAYLRTNGVHQVAEGEPVADEPVLVGATAEQPAAETLADAVGVTAPADMRDSRDAHQNGDGGAAGSFAGFSGPKKDAALVCQPWEIERIDPVEQRAQDGQRALQVIVEVGGSGGWAGVRNNLAVDIGRERAENALSDLQRIGHAMQTGNGIVLTPQGRWRLEQVEERAKPKTAPPRPRFADLRQTYLDALPGYRRQLQEEASARRTQHWERLQAEERALSRFVPLTMLEPGWRVGPERRARNLLALYPPTFEDLGQCDVYIRVQVDSEQDVAWLQSSAGGPVVYVWPHSPSDLVRGAVARVFVPAVDPTVEPLPTLDTLETR